MWTRIAGSTFVVVVTGSLLHFAWEWSGRNPVVTIFAATNESTWEHLKLAFWPALLVAPVQRALYGRLPGWLPALALRTIIPPVLIVAIFYSYTALAGRNYLALDILTFAVAVFAGETAGHVVMTRHWGLRARAAAALGVAAATVAFSTLSFAPPHWFLFEAPPEHVSASGAAHAPTSGRSTLEFVDATVSHQRQEQVPVAHDVRPHVG